MSDKDPITRASQSTTLPRQARARINMNTDPVPEGKILSPHPTHHHMPPIDVQQQQALDEGGEQQPQQGGGAVVRDAHKREVKKMHDSELGGGRHHVKPQQAGMDYLGTSTAANKKMSSVQTHAEGGGGGGNHNKHLDSVYKSAGKGNQKKG